MSSISPIGGPTQFTGIDQSSSTTPPTYLMGTLNGVAGMLSMSPADLQKALASGQSVADIAQSKGVSTGAIVSYIEQQVQQQRSSQGRPPLDSQTLDQAVNRAVTRHHGHHHHGGGGGGSTQSVSQTSSNEDQELLSLLTSDSSPSSSDSADGGSSQSTLDLFA